MWRWDPQTKKKKEKPRTNCMLHRFAFSWKRAGTRDATMSGARSLFLMFPLLFFVFFYIIVS
jgi:hypothetical protein